MDFGPLQSNLLRAGHMTSKSSVGSVLPLRGWTGHVKVEEAENLHLLDLLREAILREGCGIIRTTTVFDKFSKYNSQLYTVITLLLYTV